MLMPSPATTMSSWEVELFIANHLKSINPLQSRYPKQVSEKFLFCVISIHFQLTFQDYLPFLYIFFAILLKRYFELVCQDLRRLYYRVTNMNRRINAIFALRPNQTYSLQIEKIGIQTVTPCSRKINSHSSSC